MLNKQKFRVADGGAIPFSPPKTYPITYRLPCRNFIEILFFRQKIVARWKNTNHRKGYANAKIISSFS